MLDNQGYMRVLDKEETIREGQRGNADLIFAIGEHVKVKGGDFKVSSFGKKMLVLEGLPGARLKKDVP